MNPGSESTGGSGLEGDLHDSRDALTRILAIEGRNALARVELAASELGRFDFAPFARDRLETIHDAVGQIDALLAKIDLLATPRPALRNPGAEARVVGCRVLERLRSTLGARGVAIDLPEERMASPDLRVTCPEPVVESLLCGLIRLVLTSFEDPGALRFVVFPNSGFVIVGFEFPAGPCESLDGPGSAESRLELDVQLAEWNAAFVREWPDLTGQEAAKSGKARIGIRLPALGTGI